MSDIKIALIGGSGLYEMDGLSSVEPIKIDTPFGKPSDTLVTGRLENVKVAFLPRHGKRHHLLPNEIPYRANIYALKSLGVEPRSPAAACFGPESGSPSPSQPWGVRCVLFEPLAGSAPFALKSIRRD